MPHHSDRPTVPPAFDVEQYAKDSDARIASVKLHQLLEDMGGRPEESAGTHPRSETRMATRPPVGGGLTDEAWARLMNGAPTVTMPLADLRRLPLDHRAGFVLSLMDGSMDLETLVDASAMPREDILRIVRDLYQSGVVEFR